MTDLSTTSWRRRLGGDSLPFVDSRIYTDPGIVAEEVESIWRRTWLIVAHESELPEPRAFRTTTIADEPVIQLRGEDGKVRAFLNACPHGGALPEDILGVVNQGLGMRAGSEGLHVLQGRFEDRSIHDEHGLRKYYEEWSRRVGRRASDPFAEAEIGADAPAEVRPEDTRPEAATAGRARQRHAARSLPERSRP